MNTYPSLPPKGSDKSSYRHCVTESDATSDESLVRLTQSAELPLVFSKYALLGSMSIREEPDLEQTLDSLSEPSDCSFSEKEDLAPLTAAMLRMQDVLAAEQTVQRERKQRIKQELRQALVSTNLHSVLRALDHVYFAQLHDEQVAHVVRQLLESAHASQYCLVFDMAEVLHGVYYEDSQTGFFHRVIGLTTAKATISPAKIVHYAVFADGKFVPSSSQRFDAVFLAEE